MSGARRKDTALRPDLTPLVFYTPVEVARIFRVEGDDRKAARWAYAHASEGRFLAPHAERYGRKLLFPKERIDRLTRGEEDGGGF